MSGKARYLMSLLATALIFAFALVWQMLLLPNCADCFYEYGFPLPFYRIGGFVTIRLVLWHGLLIDLAALLLFSQFIFWAWKKFSERRSSEAM
jgi:hypothetical protein